MKSFLTGYDLANTVKMAHTQRHVTFLLVEGVTASVDTQNRPLMDS
jgi:hypothetical protein